MVRKYHAVVTARLLQEFNMETNASSVPTLITPDARSGVQLAGKLAEEIRSQLDQANSKVERPGGMNYLLPPPVAPEIIGGILFYAIAIANRGWSNTNTAAAAK
jgi:hypothetical protein